MNSNIVGLCCSKGSSSPGSGSEGKREIVLNRSRTLQRKIMRSTKDQLVEKMFLCRMEIPLRTAYGQNSRCGMQPKPSSLRAQAQQTKTKTFGH
ncbi:hypothetical protein TNCV_958591 [Trichonephila clavipes]|nr:hypothetical protein TNCV_958591 [Trichonephila clavipes]